MEQTFRPLHSLTLKTLAVLLLLVTAFATVLSGIGIGVSAVYGIYDGATADELRRGVTEDYLTYTAGYAIAEQYIQNPALPIIIPDAMPGLRFEILDEDGEVLAGNYEDGSFEVSVERMVLRYNQMYPSMYSFLDPEAIVIHSEETAADEGIVPAAPSSGGEEARSDDSALLTLRLWANSDILRGWNLTFCRLLTFLTKVRVWNIVLCAGSLVLSVMLSLFLLCSAGRRANNDGPTENAIDKIPSDLFTVLTFALEALLVILFMNGVLPQAQDIFSLFVFLTVLVYVPFMLLLIGYFMSVATRVKVGRLLSNSLLWRVLHLLGRFFKWAGRAVSRFFRSLPLVRKVVVWGAVVLLINVLLCLLGLESTVFLPLFILETIVFCVLAVRYAVSLRRVQTGIRRVADGELDAKVDTDGLPSSCRSAAEDVNRIGDGLQKAVDERIRSERFKSELITNVSHDIKTPLTSIINYVDLIKKTEPQDETLRSYVDVLDRQSTRLKKLTEDLVEASKAQSGVLAVSPEPCELSVLLEQVQGEYTEKLASRDLTLLVTEPREPLTIMADVRHLGRIFDNLMGNILKYAQPMTRVYLDAKPAILPDGKSGAVITFRNTSGEALNIPAEELMERFVRGDASRHTEGSGLGLSIVQSLTELQGGSMTLTIDGDLFKVRLSFPTV